MADFTTKEFEQIIDDFRTVERRFGMVENQKSLKDSIKKRRVIKDSFLVENKRIKL